VSATASSEEPVVDNKKRFRPRRAPRGVPEAGRSLHLSQMLGLRDGFEESFAATAIVGVPDPIVKAR
jgi:hypothetical protein